MHSNIIQKVSRNNHLLPLHTQINTILQWIILFNNILFYSTTKNHSILQKQHNKTKCTFMHSYYSIFILYPNTNLISYTIHYLLHKTTILHISYSFHTMQYPLICATNFNAIKINFHILTLKHIILIPFYTYNISLRFVD